MSIDFLIPPSSTVRPPEWPSTPVGRSCLYRIRLSALRRLGPCLLILVLGWTGLASAAERTVQDLAGETVALPAHPARIADLWFAHNELLVMLGGAGCIKMTVDRPETTPWMFKLAPVLHQATQIRGQANPEALLAEGIDLAFVSSPRSALPYRRLGIPTLAMEFQDAEGLMRAVTLTADALGSTTAQTVARRYNQELLQVMAGLKQRLGDLTEAQRPRVLHIESLVPLRVDGVGTLIDQWIHLAGGRNAAASVKGSKQPVDFEQVLAWQPDIIIVGASAAKIDQVAANAWWRSLPAVRQGRVYRDPLGIFPWDRYGSEFLLQLQWAAKTLHPERFRDLDMPAVAHRFYADYFQHDLSEADIRRMLQGLPPAS